MAVSYLSGNTDHRSEKYFLLSLENDFMDYKKGNTSCKKIKQKWAILFTYDANVQILINVIQYLF